ncbi:unnamed protein product [Orchesella dallaii]|uniref:Treslin n=1 Tax=Orchesella dallaii TaxID=48710 RepID=A0ABP1R7E6_9HEXA
MVQSSVVFLIDINGVEKESRGGNNEGGNNGQQGSHNDTMEMLPFRGEEMDEDTQKLQVENLKWLKDFVLLTLFKEANTGTDYDFGRVQWAFKFFDSSHHVDYRDGRAFMPFDYESFTSFEKQIDQRMGRACVDIKIKEEADSDIDINCSNIKFLTDALKIITGSLAWPENQNLNLSRSFNGEVVNGRNLVFACLKVPRTESDLREFADLQSISSSKDFMSVLLPSAFSTKFHHAYKIQLNFVDLRTAPVDNIMDGVKYEAESSWTGEYPRHLGKCLQYLGGGRVLAIPDLPRLRDESLKFGLVPYQKYLRLRLQQASQQNENIPSHIQRLAPKKISPECDTASVSRSLKSGPSLLESSFNNSHNHNKLLRPFRMSGTFDHDETLEYHRGIMASIKAQDRARDIERKRKRIDYEADDYYGGRYDGRHRGIIDDGDGDSVEVDSQCERDQRLESWINEGVFSAKRKKSMDHISTAVPMSRPISNQSPHVFHEPAPKLPSTRGTKMLRKVNRHSQKLTAVATHKRMSNEGMDSLKQIAQRQEKELGKIKHRLRVHLEGELDMYEDDPSTWLKTLKKQFKSFTDSVLQEDNPSLVALAQALVNNASIKFTQDRLACLRAVYKKRILVKDLLSDILLIEFSRLNTKIICARENPRDKYSPTASSSKIVQKIAFREAELQIILRLEIAWCFVEPDEDVTQDLLMEIVSLLQIIAAYRSNPPIDHFINSVLLPTYSQCNKFLRGLYKKMNIPLPSQLTIDGSPVQGNNRRDDDSSIISSTSSSVMLYPEDSASQLTVHKRRLPSTSFKRSSASNSVRKMNDASKKVKRQIMVAHPSNPKLSSSQYLMDRTDLHKKTTTGANHKSSPKRVRRNLFDVQKNDKKDSKTLITLGSSRLTKSPVFKSPRGKSPLSPSGFFRAARSRKQLILNNQSTDSRFGSPNLNAEVLCPESPATPGCDRRSVASRYAATTASGGSGERPRIIVQESPEVMKNDFDNRPMNRVASLSFYSSGCAAPKSRAWGKSEANLIAEKIKNSVDLRSGEMSAENDPLSPNDKPNGHPSESTDTPHTSLSFCDDSYVEKSQDPLPSGSNSQSLLDITGPAPGLDNPNIAALINGPYFPLSSSSITLEFGRVDPAITTSPSISNNVTGSPSNLQTPSKRVQFNLNENLVNTPSSGRRTSTGTPKSILKETHE